MPIFTGSPFRDTTRRKAIAEIVGHFARLGVVLTDDFDFSDDAAPQILLAALKTRVRAIRDAAKPARPNPDMPDDTPKPTPARGQRPQAFF